MWPIEFIKRMVYCILIGETSLSVGNSVIWRGPRENSTLGTPSQRVTPQAAVPRTQSVPVSLPEQPSQAHSPQMKAQGRITLDIGLPLDYGPSLPHRIKVTVPDNMDVTELNYQLSKKLTLNGKRWKLIVVSNDRDPRILDNDSKLERFQFTKKERLYFYPQIRVR